MRGIEELIKAGIVAVMAAVLAHCNAGCNTYVPSPGDLYAAEQSACVVQAKTESEACECRKGVDYKFGLCDVPIDRIPGPSCLKDCSR
jgi:hypothetical protein